jgi:hypothetical protein
MCCVQFFVCPLRHSQNKSAPSQVAVMNGKVFLLSRSVFGSLLIRNFHFTPRIQEAITELVPALGESITEGSIAQWVKKEGDDIKVDDVVLIVETDKVTVDIKALHGGKLIRRIASDTVSFL